MSFAAIKWAVSVDLPDPVAKLTLIILADMANLELMCFPKAKLLAQKTGLSRRSIFNALTRLEDAGFVSREKRLRRDRSWTSNAYFLEISELPHGVHEVHGGSAPDAHH